MTVLDIGVLGELTVTRDGHEVAITGPGRRALLALFAANAGRIVSVEAIVEGLWGEAPPASAVKVVQTHVSQLRRALEPDRDGDWQVLVTHPSGYRFVPGSDAVDAARFEATVQAAAGLPVAASVDLLRDALSLWRGPPYAGIDRPFVTTEAARLEQLRLASRTRCLAGELARGRHREDEPELRALAAENPLDEAVAELLMLALYRGGQQAEALRVHAELRRHLAEALGADPGPAITRLHEQVLRHDPALDVPTDLPTPTRNGGEVEAPSSRGRAPGNLPPPRSSFIGRRSQILEVARMTRERRLTTLVGAGGAGKTRLALRAATQAAADFDAVWLAALGTLDDEAHLAGHCLTELGLIDQMDREPADTLCGWISDRHLLLVLDNCEHLADAVAALVDRLLTVCPRLHVLATSRQPLRCPGQKRWRVPALSVPSAPDVEDVAASERRCPGTERCSPRPTGATTCSAPNSSDCCAGCRSSWPTSTRMLPQRCAVGHRSSHGRCPAGSPTWSTTRSSRPTRSAAEPASGCWRPSASTDASGSVATPRRPPTATASGWLAWPSPSGRTRSSTPRPGTASSTRSSCTCRAPSPLPRGAGTRRPPCGSPRDRAGR